MNLTPTLSRRWLVVDDHPQVAELLTVLLGSFGLAEIEKFTSSREAYARAHAGDFDLVVTDRDMPGLDGLELASWLHAESPAVKIILISAHTDDLGAEDLRRAGICAVLPKPFSLQRLESIVRSLANDSSLARRAA
jgi:CheY-like chemotaxis protein